MFHTLGASVCPIHLNTPMCSDVPHMFRCPHMFKHPHMSSMLPCASAYSGRYLHVIGRCGGPPSVWTPHMFGCLPMCPTPPCICMLPCMSVCSRGYLHVLWGKHPMCWGSGGISTCQAFGVCQYINWMSIMLHLVPFL